jgi:hypothetical protein
VQELLDNTPASHSDYPFIVTALTTVQSVSRRITETLENVARTKRLQDVQSRFIDWNAQGFPSVLDCATQFRRFVRDGPVYRLTVGTSSNGFEPRAKRECRARRATVVRAVANGLRAWLLSLAPQRCSASCWATFCCTVSARHAWTSRCECTACCFSVAAPSRRTRT